MGAYLVKFKFFHSPSFRMDMRVRQGNVSACVGAVRACVLAKRIIPFTYS